MATWTPSAAPVTGGARSSRKRRLRRAFLAARLALGERMVAAGIDDGALGAQVAALDHQIRHAEAARLPLGPLLARRRELLLRLAAAALEDEAPLPGADAEYGRAREALGKEAERGADTSGPDPTSAGGGGADALPVTGRRPPYSTNEK